MDDICQITPMRRLRLARGITLAEIAEAIKHNNATLSRIERGQTRASPKMAEQIAQFFGNELCEMEILYPERYMRAKRKVRRQHAG